MRMHLPVVGLFLLAGLALAGRAGADINPYIRAGYGGGQLRMREVNASIRKDQDALRSIPVSADFLGIGPGYGPDLAVGFWLFPTFRVGGAYSYSYARRENRVDDPQILYDDQLRFRMTEYSVEAAMRVVALGGLSVGGRVGQARAEMSERYSTEDASGALYIDATARRMRTTGGVFLGLDQTNLAGFVGFMYAGYQFRDMGHMPSSGTISDGVSSVSLSGTSLDMDYSGFYFQIGVGFDTPRRATREVTGRVR